MEVDLGAVDADDLIAELKRRLDGTPIDAFRYECTCSPDRRKPITVKADERFHERTGCLTCGRWDGPPIIRR